MDGYQRGRSPSGANNSSHSRSQVSPNNQSPSPHTYYDSVAGLGLDPSINANTFTTNPFNNRTPAATQPSSADQSPYEFQSAFSNHSNTSLSPQGAQGVTSDPIFFQNTDGLRSLETTQFGNHSVQSLDTKLDNDVQQFPSFLDTSSNFSQQDFEMFANPAINTSAFSSSAMGFDPQMTGMHQSINPTDLMSRMSSPPHASTPPGLRPPEAHSSPGQPASPGSNAGTSYYTPQHSRHQSLDPSSAAFPQGQTHDWQAMLQNQAFQTHRRAPSEHSEVSSVAPSPYLTQQESFESESHSPSLGAQNDPTLFDNALGMEHFTLSEHVPQRIISPAHSPYISPQLGPQQGMGLVPDQSLLAQQQNSPFTISAPEIYGGNDSRPMLQHQHNSTGEMGQAASMAPPEINVEFAPPSRTNTMEPDKQPSPDYDALSPPTRKFEINYSKI